MQLALNDDQTMLAQTADAFVSEHALLSHLRQLRDSRDERGYSLDIYRQMAELGWTAIPFSEADGGLDMGVASAILITEAMGRGLMPEPFIPSILLAGQALALGGSQALKSTWLTPAIEGQQVLALAYQEQGSRYNLHHCKVRATPTETAYQVSGEKVLVLAGQMADAYVVVARTSGSDTDAEGLTLFLVPADTTGVKTTRQWLVDSTNAAIVSFNAAEIGADAVVNIRYSTSAVMQGMSEMLAYGTAVRIQPA